MSLNNKSAGTDDFLRLKLHFFLFASLTAVIFIFNAVAFSQEERITQSNPAPTEPSVKLSSAEFIGQGGLTVDRLIEMVRQSAPICSLPAHA
jgi:hypothetical protein